MLTIGGFHIGGLQGELDAGECPSAQGIAPTWENCGPLREELLGASTASPDDEELRPVDPDRTPISDQGKAPTCVAHTWADGLELVQPPGMVVQIARGALFWAACFQGGNTGLQGTFLRAGAAALLRQGIAPEDLAPYDLRPGYDPASGAVRPSPQVLRAMARNKLSAGGFHPIEAFGDRLPDAVDQVLAAGGIVGMGNDVGEEFATWRAGQAPIGVQAGPTGGHAFLIVGRVKTPTGRAYILRNHWGTRYGDRGYALASEEFLERSRDPWAILHCPPLVRST